MYHQNLKTSYTKAMVRLTMLYGVLVNQESSCQEDESCRDEDKCVGILKEIRLEIKISGI